MFGKIFDTASLLYLLLTLSKAKLARDELDQALIEATNDDNWQASTSILHEIASSAYTHDKWKRISEFLWDKLKGNQRWKKILKAMNIVEFILKNGPGYAVDEFRRDLNFFRTLESFSAFEQGSDRGAPIRERARAIVALLTNEDFLEDERVRARQIRERMSHLSGTGNYSSGAPSGVGSTAPKYESYNSESFGKGDSNNKQFYNYGHGNYGDRDYDRNHRDDYFQHVGRKMESPKKPVQEPQRESKKAEEVKAKSIQPIIALPKKEEKASYETIAQKLMKAKPARPQSRPESNAPVVPDLSYKKKQVEDLLIDTEAHFIQNRYHFEPPKQSHQSQPETSQPPRDLPPPTPVPNTQAYTPPSISSAPVPTPLPPPIPNLLSEMDGLLFLGVQPEQKAPEAISPPTQTFPVQQAPASQMVPNTMITTANTPSSSPSLPAPPSPQQIPQQPMQPTYNYAQMAGQNQFYQPPVYPNNYGGYYNSPPQMPNAPYSYPQKGYLPLSRPVSSPYTSNPYSYQQQPQYYPQYQAPQYNNYTNPYQQAPYQPPIQPIVYSTPTLPAPYTAPVETKPIASIPQSGGKEEDFGDFKNGGSFEIEKINWMSNKEKNLTDLTDFTIDPSDRQKSKPQKKKEFTNNLKIDPWAW